MTQHHLPFLEMLAIERGRELLREAEQHRLAAAARSAPPDQPRPAAGLARASLFRVGEALVACGLALVRWAEAPRAAPASCRRLLPTT